MEGLLSTGPTPSSFFFVLCQCNIFSLIMWNNFYTLLILLSIKFKKNIQKTHSEKWNNEKKKITTKIIVFCLQNISIDKVKLVIQSTCIHLINVYYPNCCGCTWFSYWWCTRYIYWQPPRTENPNYLWKKVSLLFQFFRT